MKIIKNRNEITKDKILKNERNYILNLLERSIQFSNPENAIKRSIELRDNFLYIMNERFNIKNRKIFVIGFGKAAIGMGKGVKELLKGKIKKIIIISPETYNGRDFEFYKSSHPYPNNNSINGTKKVISLLRQLNKDDLVLFLVSGGGSSSLVLPEKGISLKDKVLISKRLIESGADIYEVNTVRKFLSAVKGGKLAEMCPAKIINLIISDVVGDRIDLIASGPTVENKTTFNEVLNVVKKYKIFNHFPHIKRFFQFESECNFKLKDVSNFVILKNISLLEEIKRISKIKSYILTSRIRGSPEIAARFLSAISEEIFFNNYPFRKPVMILTGGETEVNKLDKKGKGGPNEELCLYFLLNTSRNLRFIFTSIDTDGKDGSSSYAGGIVDNYSFDSLSEEKNFKYLMNHNAEAILTKSNDAIFTGITGTNVNDIQITYIF